MTWADDYKPMTSHELARLLLEHPDLPVATQALNSTNKPGRWSGAVNIGIMEDSTRAQWLLIGDFSRRRINYPNEYVVEVLHSKYDVPEDWPRYEEHRTRVELPQPEREWPKVWPKRPPPKIG